MTIDEIIEILDEDKAFIFCKYDDETEQNLKVLEENQLIVRCDKIPHHRMMLNPSYIYVINDKNGLELAQKYPLFTNVL